MSTATSTDWLLLLLLVPLAAKLMPCRITKDTFSAERNVLNLQGDAMGYFDIMAVGQQQHEQQQLLHLLEDCKQAAGHGLDPERVDAIMRAAQ
jgi:hypothetical protein